MIFAPSARGVSDIDADATVLGELEGIREEVLENLIQPLGISVNRRRQVTVDLNL